MTQILNTEGLVRPVGGAPKAVAFDLDSLRTVCCIIIIRFHLGQGLGVGIGCMACLGLRIMVQV